MSHVQAEFSGIDRLELIELVHRARSGHVEALDELLGTIRPAVRRLAHQSLDRNNHPTRRSDASDVTQATLLDVALGLSQFLGTTEPEFQVWLKQVIERNVLDEVRKHLAVIRHAGKERSLDDLAAGRDPIAARLTADQPTPSKGLMRSENEQMMQEVLSQLPDEIKMIIVLRDIEGWPMDAIAERLGCSERTAYRRYSKAIEDLADLLPDDL